MQISPTLRQPLVALLLLALPSLVTTGGCSPQNADPARQSLPAGRSLGYLPAKQAKSAGIDLQAAATLRPAGFDPDFDILADDARWFAEMDAVPMGERLPAPAREAEVAAEMWRDMGFVADADGYYARRADLIGGLPKLVPTHVPELAHIDCIAAISIDRHNGAEPYIYQTLRSLFAAFPAGVHINVLVSNTDVDYLSPEALAASIGPEHSGQVHVHPADAQTAAYLHAELPAYRRGGWNYARALRSYAGTKGLVLMEDDVQWSLGGPKKFDAWMDRQVLPAASLFNDQCAYLSGEQNHEEADFRINRVLGHEHYFVNLQGMFYHHTIANSLGRYLQLRMHREIYDHVVGWYFNNHKVAIGFAFPSIAQHIGKNSAAKDSTHKWNFHESSCFRASF